MRFFLSEVPHTWRRNQLISCNILTESWFYSHSVVFQEIVRTAGMSVIENLWHRLPRVVIIHQLGFCFLYRVRIPKESDKDFFVWSKKDMNISVFTLMIERLNSPKFLGRYGSFASHWLNKVSSSRKSISGSGVSLRKGNTCRIDLIVCIFRSWKLTRGLRQFRICPVPPTHPLLLLSMIPLPILLLLLPLPQIGLTF